MHRTDADTRNTGLQQNCSQNVQELCYEYAGGWLPARHKPNTWQEQACVWALLRRSFFGGLAACTQVALLVMLGMLLLCPISFQSAVRHFSGSYLEHFSAGGPAAMPGIRFLFSMTLDPRLDFIWSTFRLETWPRLSSLERFFFQGLAARGKWPCW